MVDSLSTEQRSRLMRRVKRSNTKPEMIVRRLLHARGWRYRLHVKTLPGTPDIVFPSRKAALFVNGCFWHGHSCRLGRLPSSRPEFWVPKIEANRARDQSKTDQLMIAGWRVMTVWQCSLNKPEVALEDVETFLRTAIPVAETVAKDDTPRDKC
ncbi:very short patch repair endonuclease [Rhizobium ruizarguesonis]|uniref:very short patch repair endonuclease n=1 Tax=Rhizobium ruizarguesonis TaxID=2081791 RepID=UPI001030DC24|nr:very short patch repair endonuclease [Rhizobium ruizarguesonis]TBF31489.1 DNA mismatch endonuclease Vsr [Rhizobium ruizarguesonis]